MEGETWTDAHLEHREPIRINPNDVVDHSKDGNYKQVYNRGKFQHRTDLEEY